MAPGFWKSAVVLSGAVLVYFALAQLFLLAMPEPREPVHFMVAGAFATAVSLFAAFACYALGHFSPAAIPRTVRRSGQ